MFKSNKDCIQSSCMQHKCLGHNQCQQQVPTKYIESVSNREHHQAIKHEQVQQITIFVTQVSNTSNQALQTFIPSHRTHCSRCTKSNFDPSLERSHNSCCFTTSLQQQTKVSSRLKEHCVQKPEITLTRTPVISPSSQLKPRKV